MQFKKAYHLQTVFDISDDEKKSAERAIIVIKYLLKNIRLCKDHLDLMQEPFQKNQGLTPDKLFNARVSLRKYRDQALENFRELKKIAFRLFVILQKFSADTQIKKIINSFINIFTNLEEQVNNFVSLFDKIKSDSFATESVKYLNNIDQEIEELKNIVEERIEPFIKTNILNRTWVDNISEELNEKIEQPVPFAVQLSKQINQK